MFRTYGLTLIAIAGIGLAIYTVLAANKPVVPAPPVAAPAQAPFAAFVAGAGLIEASSENIAIAPSLPGVVVEVFVKTGSVVKAGDPLFRQDDRSLRAELAVREASLRAARARLERLRAQPRKEDVPSLRAQVEYARARLADAQWQWDRVRAADKDGAATPDEISRRRYALDLERANVQVEESRLGLMLAGAWEPDLEIARAEVSSAEALAGATRTELDRLIVRAPIDARVLRVSVRPGEFAPAGVMDTPLMTLGAVETLHVRVDVDENDAWRLREGARARGFLRGNADLSVDMTFVRYEPLVVPKRSLTGASTERVDTRVLQAIYAFPRAGLPVFVGQQLDVFIESRPAERPARAEPAAPTAGQP
ncbi:MAG: HlyD family secretion protein [Phycisphaerae bacterium]|nr:HlyD family secretion protein [Phycisphaerae bacterium]